MSRWSKMKSRWSDPLSASRAMSARRQPSRIQAEVTSPMGPAPIDGIEEGDVGDSGTWSVWARTTGFAGDGAVHGNESKWDRERDGNHASDESIPV